MAKKKTKKKTPCKTGGDEKKKKSRMGRPEKLNWNTLDAVLQYNAELSDAAEILDVHPDTIGKAIRKKYQMTFSEYRKKKLGRVKIKLIQKAYERAMDDKAINNTMHVFCLKNMAGWSDKQEVNTSHSFEDIVDEVLGDEDE